ncbi:hypothetical protein [Neobacillus cucumis]|uniref:hypothetical protein n=1 Tax=Neobacillus cucumis TaxID=1740721 RepID=UPI0019633521|nr:hypothetical protein [Neobacillus cucumis]MBM7654444.1 hypothetical protein [Neobacillus cucumis]
MLEITTIQEIADVLAGIEHPLAASWGQNDLIKKNIATSFEYWLEDTGIPITLTEFVEQYLAHSEYLGEMFLTGSDRESG